MHISADWITSDATQAVCRMLTEPGHQALFVGGSVRNTLLGLPVHDIDIASDATPIVVIGLAEAVGMRVVRTGMEHGTVTVINDGISHEITTFRKDVITDGRRAVVAYCSDIEEDARRRDFTMNALYARPDGTIVDPLGGLADLNIRRVRFIDDAETRIKEDYLRSLRFFRFHAIYGDPAGGIDAQALAAIGANLDGIGSLSAERVGSEMLRLLGADDPAPAMAAMRACGLLATVLPGADDRALGVLVDLETRTEAPPDAVRRLAALGGKEVEKRLRLSRSDARRVSILRDAIGAGEQAALLGYRHGQRTAADIVLLRHAVLTPEIPLTNWADIKDRITQGANAEFPLVARDLMPDFSGPALGEMLKSLESRWIKSDFKLDRGALLNLARKGGDDP